jgi:PAS domain S-box-containing protein
MWDIATPLIVGGQHVGNIFSGQFFFEDEPVDYELFRSQARKYGFNEEEYIAALEKVPRLSPTAMDMGMAFLAKLAHMISRLSYSNIKLAQSLAEREALVAALRESEEKYRNIVETANEGIWIIDAEDRTTYVNKKMAEMLGYNQGEMIGRSGWDFTDEEDKEVSRLNMEKRQQSIDESHEFKFIRKDGSPLWTLVNIKSFFNRDGRFTGSMGMLTDITKRKEVEEALIRSEKEFRTLTENAPDMIARFDRQNRHIYVNPAVVENYGRSQEEIIGKTHHELGMDPEKVKFWEEHHKKVFATGKPETMEFQYTSPKGKEYCFNTQVVPEFVDSKVASVLAISHDITDIKKAESRLKETLNNLEELVKARTSELEEAYKSLEESEKGLAEAQKMAHIGNWNWDIATDKAYWSDELYRIFRRNPQESGATYDELLNYIHPDDRDYVNNVIKKRLNGKTHGIDSRIILADGEELIVHAESEVIFDEKNVPVRARGIVQDITERKKAEKALINLEIARKKEIHHRIKNNLQVISSLLDLQAEKFKNRKWVENSEVLESFRESQDRVISMALIHEELHEGEGVDTLNFSQYLQLCINYPSGSKVDYTPPNSTIDWKF